MSAVLHNIISNYLVALSNLRLNSEQDFVFNESIRFLRNSQDKKTVDVEMTRIAN